MLMQALSLLMEFHERQFLDFVHQFSYQYND